MGYNCDYEVRKGYCGKKPYMECYYEDESDGDKEGESHWCYFCFWHYIWVRFIRRDKDNGYAKVDTDRKVLVSILEELWDIQDDLWKIKKKLGIKEKKIDLKVVDDEETDVHKENI